MLKSVTHDHVPWIGAAGVGLSFSLGQIQQFLGILVALATFGYVVTKWIAFIAKWRRDRKPPVAE